MLIIRALVVSMSRKAVRDYTFADGTFIPKGTMVVAATHCLHFEADRYGDPAVFDPRRYDGLSSSKDNLTTMNDHYWSFGHGQHAWCVLRSSCDQSKGY